MLLGKALFAQVPGMGLVPEVRVTEKRLVVLFALVLLAKALE